MLSCRKYFIQFLFAKFNIKYQELLKFIYLNITEFQRIAIILCYINNERDIDNIFAC